MCREVLMNASIYSRRGGFPPVVVYIQMDRYVCFGRQMAVVLADVVVVKRCKEERTPCPYISFYTTVPLVFPRCIYIHINISPFSPSSFLPLIRDSSEYTTQQPSLHQTAYTCKRQTFTATQVGTLNIAPQSMLTLPLTRTLYYLHLQNKQPPPLPPISALSPKSSPETPKQKRKCRAGEQNLKKTSRVQCMPPPRGVSAKKTPECNPGFTVV